MTQLPETPWSVSSQEILKTLEVDRQTGLSQTQNETFSREQPDPSEVMDELKNFLDSFGEDKYIRSINGVATDG